MAHRSAGALHGVLPLSRLWSLVRIAATSRRTLPQILIVLQNSTLIAVLHRSRAPVQVPTTAAGDALLPPPRRYLASTAILLVEVTKLLVSITLVALAARKAHPADRLAQLARRVATTLWSADALLLVVPAALYTLQNFLIYVAISNMRAVAFQVTYQLKILTTVLFSILLLRKTITARQWLAMVLLTLGVAVVQLSQQGGAQVWVWPSLVGLRGLLLSAFVPSTSHTPLAERAQQFGSSSSPAHTQPLSSAAATALLANSTAGTSTSKGVLAAVGAAVISGLTSVYFEKLVKQSLATVSLWTRNAQLAFFSLFPALFIGVLWQDGAAVARDGFFAGYRPIVWAVVALQALGGLLVALCVAYADNVAKNFAASLSIVVSCVLGSLLFAEPVTPHTALGISAVLLATYLYQSRGHRPAVDETLLPMNKEER